MGAAGSSDEESDIEGMAVIGEDGESLDDEEEEKSAGEDGTPGTAGPPEQCKHIKCGENTK